MAASKVIACSCSSSFQDERYGKDQRVHNRCKDGKAGNTPDWRCTVCSSRKSG